MAEDTVEGAELALATGPAFDAMLEDGRLTRADMPLTGAILQAIREDAPFAIPWTAFHHRTTKDS